jgi:hypothetical protein
MGILVFAYKEMKFECDITHQYHDYKDLHLVRYDRQEFIEGINYISYQGFMLIKKDGGLDNIKSNFIDKDGQFWTLSQISLEEIYDKIGNPVIVLSSFLCSDSGDKAKKIKKIIEPYSYQRVLRRLTISGFEEIKDSLSDAKNMENFLDYTDEMLLHKDTIRKFKKEILSLYQA